MAQTFYEPRRLVGNLVYDSNLLEWVAMTQPGASDVTVGTVDQGGAGLDPWLVTGTLTIDTAGLATDTAQATGNASLASIDGKLTNPLPISGAVTNANLDVALSTRLKAADTLAAVTTVGTITNVVHVDDNASTLSVDDGAGSITVDGTVAVSGTVTVTESNENIVTGSITTAAGSALTIDTTDRQFVHVMSITGPGTATGLLFKGIQDDGSEGPTLTYYNASGRQVQGNPIIGGEYWVPVAGYKQIKFKGPTDTGSMTVTMRAVAEPWQVFVRVASQEISRNTPISPGGSSIDATGSLVYGLVNTSSPSYVDNRLQPPSLTTAGAIRVDGSAVTQPVSATSLPLPTLAATSTKQSDGTQKTQIVDGSANVIGATSNALDINIKSGNPTTITATQGTATNLKTQAEAYQGGVAVGAAAPLQVTLANTGSNATAVKVDGSAVTQPVSGSVSVTGNPADNIAQVNGATVNVGTGAAGTGTLRVTTSTDSTIGTVTSVTAIANALPAGTNAIGKLAANSGVDIGDVDVTSVSGNVTVVQPTGTNLHTVVDSGTLTAVTAITNALPAGSAILGKVGIDQTTPGATNGVQVNAAIPAGSNIIGNIRIDQTTPGTTNAVQANAGTNLNTSLLALEAGGNLASLVAKDFATAANQTTELAYLASLIATLAAQGASYSGVTGQLTFGKVNETNESYTVDTLQPLSTNLDGRLRVIAPSDEGATAWDTVSAFDIKATLKGFALENHFTLDTVWS